MDRENGDPPLDDDDDQFDASDFAEDSDNQTTGITEPRDSDVMCGRGGAALRHPGNQTYRKLVNLNKGLYITCLKTEKLKISRSIVAAIRAQNGRFLEKDNAADSENKGKWYDIGDKKAVEKTSQALREGQPKLRQKIAELGNVTVGANGIPDINPHSLPYAAPPSNQQSQIMSSTSAAASNTFHGSTHSMGSSSFSMNESGILSTGASIYSVPYGNQAEIVAVRNNNGSMGVLMPPPPTPPFFQHQNTSRNGSQMIRNVSTYNPEHQEYQVQRMQAAENPHHRDIPINNMMNNNSGNGDSYHPHGAELNLHPDLLQRLSLHDVSVSSGSTPPQPMGNINSGGFHLQPSNSGISGFGMSIRTVDSNALNSVDTFNSLTNNSTGGVLNRLMNLDNPQQRLALARELGIEESQLSLLSTLDPSNNGGNQSMVNLSRHTSDTPDIFQNGLNELPINRGGGGNNNHLNFNNHGVSGGGISHINLDYNTSMTSCISNHSAFTANGGNSMGMQMNLPQGGGLRAQGSTSFQQYVQNQHQNQQQQLQQRQQLLLQQRQQNQLRRQQQNAIQSQQIQSFQQAQGAASNDNNVLSDAYDSHNDDIVHQTDKANRRNSFDRRQVFATMKFSRPPSVREQDPVSVPVNHGGQLRNQQQPIHQRQQPEVTKVKVSDGIGGGRSNVKSESGNDYSMVDSNNSICSNFTMNTMDSKEPIDDSPGNPSPKKIEVLVETAKLRDHSTKREQVRKEEFMSGNNGSKRSIMSGMSEYSIFSDLSKKIGNVSTRSMAMSEMSSVDHLDMDDPEVDDDDDVNNNHDVNETYNNDDKQHSYEDDIDLRYRANVEIDLTKRANHAISTGTEGSKFPL